MEMFHGNDLATKPKTENAESCGHTFTSPRRLRNSSANGVESVVIFVLPEQDDSAPLEREDEDGLAAEIITRRAVVNSSRNHQGAPAPDLENGEEDGKGTGSEMEVTEGAEEEGVGDGEAPQTHLESFITQKLQGTNLEDGPMAGEEQCQHSGLSPQEVWQSASFGLVSLDSQTT